jgi:TonB-linked SusC/RagA family outer membrane protein
MINFRIILTAGILLQFCFLSSANGTINLQNSTIEFSNNKLTVKQALDELNKLRDISIFYGSKEKFLNLHIEFSSRSMTVQKALDEIKSQAPVLIVFNKDHVIVKGKEISEHFSIYGTVKDAALKDPLIGAMIYIKEAANGVTTDLEGKYSLSLQPGKYQLVCRFLGYKERKINIDLFQDQNLEILMEVAQNLINEVRITGNVTDLRSLEKGRSIETIQSKVVNQLNTNDVNDVLVGRIAGVWTTKVSGAPGDHNRIRIRGISSIFGSSDPLYVVDGVIIPVVNFKTLGISDLNTHDVNNITVLKDASSSALYGCMGGNGVVIIETKKGGGKTSFDFSIKKGFQACKKRYDLMNAETFLSTLDSSDLKFQTKYHVGEWISSDHAVHFATYPLYKDADGNTLGSEDFQDELFQTGEINEYQLSGQGRLRKIDYYLSGNHYNHKGIITNSSYNKYSFTGNISKVVGDKMSIRALYKGSHQENKNNLDNYMGNNVIFKGINLEPAYRSTPDSFFIKSDRLYYNDLSSPSVASLAKMTVKPDSLFYSQKKSKIENLNSVNLVGFYRLNEAFSLRSTFSVSLRDITYSSFIPATDTLYSINNLKFLSSKENINIINQEYDLSYDKQWQNHGLNAFIRYRNYNDNVYWKIDSIANVELDGISLENDIYLKGSQAIYGEHGSVIRSINSAIFNINYNYKKKYFISLINNYDKLKEGAYVSKGNLYSSIALNWDLAKEGILHFPDWISAFNLYVNRGQSGNYPLNSLSNDLYSTSSSYVSFDEKARASYISTLANHYLVPEKVTETNYGSELALFNHRVILSADYYQKINSDLLIQRNTPLYYGGGFFYQNIGEMKNSGLELSLELTPVKTRNCYWNTKAGFSTNNQYISKLSDGATINFNSLDILIPDFIVTENETLGSLSGYNCIGKWSDLSKLEIASKKYFNKYGFAYLKNDTLNPKRLTPKDKTIIGNSLPDFTFNWLNDFEFKNFSCEMLWYGVIGADKYNATKASTFITGTNSEVRDFVIKKYRSFSDPTIYESNYFLEDASFIRLKTLSFTYTQPRKIASVIGLQYTLSFENLVTLTHYTGYDPEATIYTNNNFTDNAMDRGAYPNAQGVYFSIHMTF